MSNHFIVQSDDDLDRFSTPPSDVDTLPSDHDDGEEEDITTTHLLKATTKLPSVASSTTLVATDECHEGVARRAVSPDTRRSSNSHSGVASGGGTIITASLLSMLANNGPSRKGSQSGGDTNTLPLLPRQTTLPMPILRSQSSSLGSNLDSTNTINSPGSPKVIYGLLSEEESMPRPKGSLTSLPDNQHRGGDFRGDGGISMSGVVHPIPTSPRGNSKRSIPLPTVVNSSHVAAFGRKTSIRSSSCSRHSNNSSSRKEGSFSGTLSKRQSSFTNQPALLPMPPSASSSEMLSPRQRRISELQTHKDEETRKLKLLSFIGVGGVVGN